MGAPVLPNYIAGEWSREGPTELIDILDPAEGRLLARTPASGAREVGLAVAAAERAFPAWRARPVGDRVQPLFRLKALLEEHLEELARAVTLECGKTLAESRGELRRAIENVETACGAPTLMQGYNCEDVAAGIDESMIRQPLGVVAVIAPFNFPAMIPMWFTPYALACGNTVVLKPSDRTPMTMRRIVELFAEAGLPPGVLNLVHGAKAASDAILDHPAVRAVSFVGSTPVAKYVYARAAAAGKRAQCQGGAKNPIVVMPDADLDSTVRVAADSAFGCAGQRCLASSLAVPVGAALGPFSEAIREAAAARVVGRGIDEGVEMGPVISAASKRRIAGLIAQGIDAGARALIDGREARVPGCEDGFFLRPTVLTDVAPNSETARTEIFGPVLGITPAATLDEAIAAINSAAYGNMACIFTSDGAAARKFRHEVEAGNIGVNVGVAAPMAQFPFSGWKESFFGDMHAQGRGAFAFFTQEKVVVERWPKEWSRKF